MLSINEPSWQAILEKSYHKPYYKSLIDKVLLAYASEKIYPDKNDILTIGKCDLINNTKTLAISGKTGDGLDALLKEISLKLTNLSIGAQTATRERHRVAMISAQKYLDAGKLLVSDELELSELASSEFHQGIQCLSSLIGSVGVEDLLDEIFSSFCLGK